MCHPLNPSGGGLGGVLGTPLLEAASGVVVRWFDCCMIGHGLRVNAV